MYIRSYLPVRSVAKRNKSYLEMWNYSRFTSSGTNEGKFFPIYVHTYQVYVTPDFLQFLLTNK
jgi:hypothetical protein